ncbi:hypothetical protein [Frondihabitans cladoniiphilus]|uniref:Nucleotidyl transferase AbiEii/AbiGii toxin family protein n=1 Tax=Frondihabitans cladoniiphilus TaxID=715785 RepID=A0ABP8VPJ0_9MICO
MIRVAAVAPCTSNADDLAFASLADAVRATEGMPDSRVVGGHMVGLLLTAFPIPGLSARRTTDADAGLSTAIAARGDVTGRLLELGYLRVDGSRFERDGRTVDLLVEVAGSKFRPRDFEDGQLDGSPGLDLALATDPIEIDTTVVYTDGRDERFVVRVPTVEWATVIKAYAAESRLAAKDIADLHHLLEIRHLHGRDSIGGWRLDDEPAMGRRLDAARVLRLVKAGDSRLHAAGVRPARFIELVREHVAPLD